MNKMVKNIVKLSKEISAVCGGDGSRIDADISHLLSLEWL